MNETPLHLDPERLKKERHDVDLGVDEETAHSHAAHEIPPTGNVDASHEPTSGSTPPAR